MGEPIIAGGGDITGVGTVNAFLAAVGGALADAAASGAVTNVDTAMAYLKQLVTEGIARDAALTAAGPTKTEMDTAHALLATEAKQDTIDTVVDAIKAVTDLLPNSGALSDLATILALVDSAETAGPFSYLDAGGEQDVIEDTAVTRRRVSLEIDLSTMTQNGTIKLFRKVDGSTYVLYTSTAFVVADGLDVFDAQFTTNQAWKLTYTEGADEGAARSIPFNTVTEVIE